MDSFIEGMTAAFDKAAGDDALEALNSAVLQTLAEILKDKVQQIIV